MLLCSVLSVSHSDGCLSVVHSSASSLLRSGLWSYRCIDTHAYDLCIIIVTRWHYCEGIGLAIYRSRVQVYTGQNYIVALGKLRAPVCLYYQAVLYVLQLHLILLYCVVRKLQIVRFSACSFDTVVWGIPRSIPADVLPVWPWVHQTLLGLYPLHLKLLSRSTYRMVQFRTVCRRTMSVVE